MKKTIFGYGILLAALTGLLKFIEYRYWVRDLTIEMYIGAIALLFTALGVWVGLKWTGKKPPFPAPEQPDPHQLTANVSSFLPTENGSLLEKYGISKREHEVLVLIAKGLSNQEIADTLFLSANTVKTHSSNLFLKLDVKRRTQAVQKAIEIGLLQ